ncbi:MAG: AAA family ATPase [Desulfobulbaceae bacterium]|nr:AAA family ATPase [Desulfobulbaceae bacterium]
MTEKHTGLPDQKELEKEIGDYLSRKYGDRVKIVSAGFFPQADGEKEDCSGKSDEHELPFHFDLKPEELVAYLDEYIIKQDRAKAVLATKICTHFNRIRFIRERRFSENGHAGRIKNNILLIGPTGVGKTFLIKLIAARLGVPFVKGDATKFSETGYVGGDVDDLVRDLVREADGDLDRAQYGIIYVDEIDKIAGSVERQGLDVSRTGVQRALLKPMEETDVEMKVPHDMISQLEAMEQYRATGKRQKKVVNTRNILFIMSGAFDGLNDIIGKRLHRQTIGFEGRVVSAAKSVGELASVKADDLVRFGFEREFVGRLPVCAVLEELTAVDLRDILLNPNCALVNAKKLDFLVYGIRLCFDPEVFSEIAQLALAEKTGARGLSGVVENLLLPFEKRLPSTSVQFLVVDRVLLKNPEAELQRLLLSSARRRRHKELFEKFKKLEFERLLAFLHEKKQGCLARRGVSVTPARLEMMANQIVEESCDADAICEYFGTLVNHIKEWQQRIGEKGQLKVTFDDAAIDHVLSLQPRTLETIDALCKRVQHYVVMGLQLLRQKQEVAELMIPIAGVLDPEKFINELVEKTYRV